MVIRGLAEKHQRQDGQRRALAPPARLLRADSAHNTGSKVGLWIVRVHHTHRSDKSVAFAHHGFKEARFSGVVTKSGADFSHNVVDVGLGIDEQIRAPQFADDLLARNHLVATAHQEYQQLHGLLFAFDSPSLAAELVTPQVQFDLAHGRSCTSHRALKGHYPLGINDLRRYGKDRQTVSARHWNNLPPKT